MRKARVFVSCLIGIITSLTVLYWNLHGWQSFGIIIGSIYQEDTFERNELQHPDVGVFYSGKSRLPLATGKTLDMYINLDVFRKKLSVKNVCSNVTNVTSLWKSPPTSQTKFTAKSDFRRIQLASWCGGILIPEYLHSLPRKELYPFEAYYLSEPPIWSINDASSYNHSNIKLVGQGSNFTVGDKVTFIMKIYNKKGQPKTRGGDRIKVWLKDSNFNHSISAKITDFDNGTYMASTVLPWAGTLRVIADLQHTREYVRAMIYTHIMYTASVAFAGVYNNTKANESAPCNAYPIIPSFKATELCNLTEVNGFQWYCGRPSKPELSCSDYRHFTFISPPLDPPVTPAEATLLKTENRKSRIMQGNIVLNVHPSKSGVEVLKDPDVPCDKVTPKLTWRQPIPPGFLYNREWKSFQCRIPGTVDASCFRNVQMFFYGDSNARLFYYHVKDWSKCRETIIATHKKWHAPLACVNETDNFEVKFLPHSHPFLAGSGFNKFDLTSPTKLLDMIPSSGRYIVAINHYLHFVSNHISVYENALMVLHDVIKEMLRRNPDGQVILRAPQVTETMMEGYMGSDHLAQYFCELQRKVFSDLQDKVLYFPIWDMTVAAEDIDNHPKINDQIFKWMLQILCGRQEVTK